MLSADETQALAARARTVARAVVGLVIEEERAAGFVQRYTLGFGRLGLAGEAEHKAELLAAIERESLLLVAARIERTLPRASASRFSRQSETEAVASFRQAFLTFLGGSLAWDQAEREAFRRDLGMYLRLFARESDARRRRGGPASPAGVFVDRCAFLLDPSMMGQAREAAARYQAELESCADQAVRAAFRGFHPRSAAVYPGSRPPTRVRHRGSAKRRQVVRRSGHASRRKGRTGRKSANRSGGKKNATSRRPSQTARRKSAHGTKAASRRKPARRSPSRRPAP